MINQTPERPASVYLLGLWPVFLLVGLSLPVTYLLQAPAPVGTGLLRVFGWGGLIGAGVGAIVRLSCSSIFDARTWWSRIRVSAGCIALGAFGGAGGGAWLDQLHVVERQAVELPIVKVEQLPQDGVALAFKSRPSHHLIRQGQTMSPQKTSMAVRSRKVIVSPALSNVAGWGASGSDVTRQACAQRSAEFLASM